MPWRNGGGTTTELVVAREGEGRFLYRVSVADVASDGPFSRFEGYDRHILLIDGAGMKLACGQHGDLDLTPFVPRSFSGDWDVHGVLVDGAVRDFNFIVDRSRASSSIVTRLLDGPVSIVVEPAMTCIVHVLAGSLDGAAEGDTLVADAAFELVPHRATHVVIAAVTRG